MSGRKRESYDNESGHSLSDDEKPNRQERLNFLSNGGSGGGGDDVDRRQSIVSSDKSVNIVYDEEDKDELTCRHKVKRVLRSHKFHMFLIALVSEYTYMISYHIYHIT